MTKSRTAQPKTAAEAASTRFLPAATIGLLVLNAATYALQWLYPALLPAFNRSPAALAAGQWWRLVTPMLVDPDPLWVVASKFVGLALVGLAVERSLGQAAWLVIYLVSGVAGEVFGYAWDPNSAGYSLPLFGLIGALFVLVMAHKPVRPPAAVLVALAFIAGVIIQRVGGILVTVLFGLLAGSLGWFLLRRKDLTALLTVSMGSAGLLGGALLVALRDIHGPAALMGAGLAAVFLSNRIHSDQGPI